MENTFKISGVIIFDPEEITSKQSRQGVWKKTAMVLLEPDLKKNEKGIADYYAWFVKKRYNLTLQKPMRDAHVTFINDRGSDMNGDWEKVKKKWNGKKIDVVVHVDPFVGIKNRKGNYCDWWLTVPYEYRDEMQSIRKELDLDENPYFGLHMTIGTAVNFNSRHREKHHIHKQYNMEAKYMFEEHSEDLLKLAQNDMLNLGEIPTHQKK